MTSPFLGEFLGTMTLIILGDGVVAGALLKKSKGENAGWIAITAGWAFAVLAGIFVATATGSPDAHLNPAVTVAGAVSSGDVGKLAVYIPAQMLGAFVGAVIVWLHYLPHWAATPERDLKLACFCTGPAIRDAKSNWISEIIATFVLILTISALVTNTLGASGAIPGAWPPTWSACWSGASACRSAAPPATPSTPPATSGRASPTRCCRSPARAPPTGATR